MSSLSIIKKGLIAASVVLTIGMLGSTQANAQSRREIERQRQRIEQQNNARWERERQRQQRRDRGNNDERSDRYIANANYTQGYQNGYLAGTSDGRKGKYNRSNVYRNTGSYPNGGDTNSIDYIYRQGYLAGYEDGFRGRRNY
jgi:Ni/Co efflux regulator RcnB